MKLPGDHRICFVGDSFVQGTCDPECRGWVGRVASTARAVGFNVTAYNLGVRRDTSRDIFSRWATECAARLPAHCATYVVFSFGVNDTVEEAGGVRVGERDSVANLAAMISAAREKYRVAIVGPPVVADAIQNERILRLCASYEVKAVELGVPYLALAPKLAGNALWLRELAANDGSHPGLAGYDLMAAMIGEWSSWWFTSESARRIPKEHSDFG